MYVYIHRLCKHSSIHNSHIGACSYVYYTTNHVSGEVVAAACSFVYRVYKAYVHVDHTDCLPHNAQMASFIPRPTLLFFFSVIRFALPLHICVLSSTETEKQKRGRPGNEATRWQ